MYFLTIILTIFLIILGIGTITALVYLVKENNKLTQTNTELNRSVQEKTRQNKELQDKLDALMKQPSFVGLSYRTDNKELQQIMQNLRNIFVELQMQACPALRKSFLENRQQYVDNLVKELQNKSVKCSDLSSQIYDFNNVFAMTMASSMAQQMPNANQDVIERELKQMLDTYVRSVCVDDKVDVAKLNQFLVDVFGAICYR